MSFWQKPYIPIRNETNSFSVKFSKVHGKRKNRNEFNFIQT